MAINSIYQEARDTILLDSSEWDMILDSKGNIAMASPPYAIAQDVASAIRLFNGELWYNDLKGVPYWENIIGKYPPLSLVKAKTEEAAFTVPGVKGAKTGLLNLADRRLTGVIAIIDEAGVAQNISFG